MLTESVLDRPRLIKAISFVLIGSMLVLSMMAGAAQGHGSKKNSQDIVKLEKARTINAPMQKFLL